ncbi:ABC transporter ATP-binding protein [Crateriforma conspicua]|uniref:ABC transporter ATP-binding protein n=1 Tax=Crateriforma conspicua TaxID=2527996 RepID=UPI00118B7A63|nr:ABC transporter ATP-binding protein [Crateriforma conspicua]QDV63928.1 ABC transporter ATP-binding protein YxdL [Crateriforma conspicua]
MNESTTPCSSDSTAPGLRACELRSVDKTYQQGGTMVQALSQVDLTIPDGAFVSVMGASGSGKSTLLHLMAGLTRPTRGSVIIDGDDLSQSSDIELTRFRRSRIGLVFQALNLVPSLSAADNILLPLMASGKADNTEDRLRELAETLGIADRLDHRPDALSGGEQQRVAIARGLIADPAILLADEPTGNLDSKTGQSICQTLRTLCDTQGRTIVMVTHEPAVAIWSDLVIVLKDGQIIHQIATKDHPNPQSLAIEYQTTVDAERSTTQPQDDVTTSLT